MSLVPHTIHGGDPLHTNTGLADPLADARTYPLVTLAHTLNTPVHTLALETPRTISRELRTEYTAISERVYIGVVPAKGLESSTSRIKKARIKRTQTPPDVSPSSPHTSPSPLITQSNEKVAAYLLYKEGDRENKERSQEYVATTLLLHARNSMTENQICLIPTRQGHGANDVVSNVYDTMFTRFWGNIGSLNIFCTPAIALRLRQFVSPLSDRFNTLAINGPVTWRSRGKVSDFCAGGRGSILGPGTDLSDYQTLPSPLARHLVGKLQLLVDKGVENVS
uniref:Uncharacterized protein n=1 Tax=Timema cristinae TaxID=61476 RepID=A0A7R9CMD9_TIMCR|nr:unnamed protein product [Timema cristinae]